MSDPSETVDDEVLRLRREGQAYARISRDLGLNRAADAQQAFRRAVRRLPAAEAEEVREEELSRLDRLAERVRADTSKNDMDRARQLKTIQRMRGQISRTMVNVSGSVPEANVSAEHDRTRDE